MKRILSLATVFALVMLFGFLVNEPANAQTPGNANGKARMFSFGPFDDDGDGIPNCDDPDYVKPKDGTGRQFGKTNGGAKFGNGKRGGYGPGDGTGNQGIGPRDGSGYGPGNGTGTGVCDGTGPKGKVERRGRR
ncbi:MAG: hypothetical protein ONB44_10915 [candidate division KSB1 bacterium]|nr:hypothetical protein [candidate division KSB1 bacterium]MDZ7302635.1 hypothetical protein [candidate division KSB1 bacterium]MDZ7311526.1 hypothetical protein [candidate division KSB1 bacterium]